MGKVLIVGMDGATFDLVAPWAKEGKLPTLQRLMNGGTWGPLESTVPPMTSPAWPTFATGKFPAKHGVFDFVSARSGTFNVINATAVDARPLWDILSSHGKRVGVMNVPVTYPPREVNGFLISGLLSPASAKVTYPDDLLGHYEKELGRRYRVMPSVQYKPGQEEEFFDDLQDLIDQRARFASRLMSDQPWDFTMVHFLSTDLVQHALWRHMDTNHPRHEPGNAHQDAILRVFQRVDVALGKLLGQLDDDATVIIMSDHGFGPLHGVVNLNMLLWEKGLLHFKRTPMSMLRAFAFRRGITPSFAYSVLAKLNLHNIVSRVSKSTRNAAFNKFLSFNDIDWSRTVAYSLGHMGQIYLNVKGREPQGIVERDGQTNGQYGYEQTMQAVIDALQELTTLDGQPMLDRVIRSDELPSGSHADEGPDLHVVLDAYRYISCPLFATDPNVLSKQIRGDSGCHRMNGALIVYGPHVRHGARIENARIVDLAPTVLHLMGCPIPGDMDGRVLTELLNGDFLAEREPEVEGVGSGSGQDAYVLSDAEEAELEERLKGLGYLG